MSLSITVRNNTARGLSYNIIVVFFEVSALSIADCIIALGDLIVEDRGKVTGERVLELFSVINYIKSENSLEILSSSLDHLEHIR